MPDVIGPREPAVLVGGPEDGASVDLRPGTLDIHVAEQPDMSALFGDDSATARMPKVGRYVAAMGAFGRPSRDDTGRIRMVWTGWS